MYQRIGLHLTDRCQLDCDHCLRDPDAGAVDLPTQVVEGALREAGKTYGIRHVSFTGGEPTLHPEFLSIVDLAAALDFSWDMVTNGATFPRILPQLELEPGRRRSLRSVTFSLDGAEEATHDGIRGAGSYRAVLSAISVAAVAGVPFGVQMAIHARNQQEIEALGLLAAQLGAKHVAFCWTQPTGTPLDQTLYLDPPAWRRIYERIRSLSGALSVDVVAQEGFPQDGAPLSCGPVRSETLHVDAHGRLSLCCMHSGIPGPDERAVSGPVADGGLVPRHLKLLGIIHDLQVARLNAVASGELNQPWGRFQCNWCLHHMGRPSWTEGGTAGAPATRARWVSLRTQARPLAHAPKT